MMSRNDLVANISHKTKFVYELDQSDRCLFKDV